MKKYLFYISIIFISCQDEITLDLPQAGNKIVVQATIEEGYPPYVILSSNQAYFDPIDSTTFSTLFEVEGIESVKIWYNDENGMIEESKNLELIPNELSELIFEQPLPVYTVDDIIDNTTGFNNYSFSQAGKTYFLEIKWNGQTITSQTTIPYPTPLDCLWVQQSETAEKEFKCDIRAVYSDPSNQQNNILIKSKRLQHFERNKIDTDSCVVEDNYDVLLKLIDAGSDILINGQSFETYFPRPSENGFPTGNYNAEHTKKCDEDSIKYEKDIVLIKFCQIDEISLRFWRGLIRQAGTNGNPFAEPSNLSSNINGGSGFFTGYGAVYYKIPIVKDTTIFNTINPEIKDIF
jgi:hypothetical protein